MSKKRQGLHSFACIFTNGKWFRPRQELPSHLAAGGRQGVSDLLTRLCLTSSIMDLSKGRENISVAVTTKTQKVVISSSAMLWNINYRGIVTIRVSAVNIVSAVEETEDVLCSSRKLSCFFKNQQISTRQAIYIHTHTNLSSIGTVSNTWRRALN